MRTAIYYHPSAYSTNGPKLMGRNAAGESFLRGYLSYSKTDEFWVQVIEAEHAKTFAELATQLGRQEKVQYVTVDSLSALTRAELLYYPGPDIGASAWHRANTAGPAAWSLCGITHTTSSAAAMDGLVDLLVAPVQTWDAVICTSAAVKDNVRRVLQAQADYLKDRLGISKLVMPELPVIPLGIHTADFAPDVARRQLARAAMRVPEDTLVVLYMGRLSFHAKAHPLAMYQALEQAAAITGKKVMLVECGWHANESIAQSFAAAARLSCPSVTVVTLDGRKPEQRQLAWAGADVFCSLSDNVQETFGIVPIEAMAAGLPVVVSDWDGYKDTVRDGIDGFRVSTTMPPAGAGVDLARRHALGIDTYDKFCGHACSFVAVDVAAAAACFVRLFESPELRRKLGQAGLARAREVYDWASIIPRYEALWQELGARRLAAQAKLKPGPQPWPARLDPFQGFANYPSRTLLPTTVLTLVDADVDTALQRLQAYGSLLMVNFGKPVLPNESEIRLVLQAVASGPILAADLVRDIPANRRNTVFRGLAWLIKLHVLKQM